MQLLFLLFAVEVGSLFETLSCHSAVVMASALRVFQVQAL